MPGDELVESEEVVLGLLHCTRLPVRSGDLLRKGGRTTPALSATDSEPAVEVLPSEVC